MKYAAALLVLIFIAPSWALAQVNVVPPNPLPADGLAVQVEQEGVETLTRGPIHEAFANPAEPDPEPGPVVPKQPPADVPEQPPDYQPESGEHEWISGYWEWDDDRDEFLWVTGVWRQAPPDMRWVTGYWHEVGGGWQRVKGFWVGEQVDNVTYYQEAPPQTLEAGPSSPQPSESHFWIPGSWNYADTGYAWQGGYWAPYQPNWVWSPSRWCWTPAGYVFLPGHWDHRLATRGQIFAPVYFSNTVYSNPGWYYRPSVVIPTDNLFIHLWVRPRNNCYYFGNYYGTQYAGRGFVPWANLHVQHRHRHYYDPFHSYCRVHYRQQGVDFVGRVQGWHRYYDDHPDHRPARNWREQQEWLASSRRPTGATANTQLVARNLADVAGRADASVKVRKIDAATREAHSRHASQVRESNNERRTIEREQAQVSARLPSSIDRGKAGSLVERAEKGGRGDKADRPDKSDRADAGEKGDRGEKGEKGGKGRPGDNAIAKTSTSAKLTLPKVDTPRPGSTTARDSDGKVGKSDRREKAPPLPTASRRPAGSDDRTPGTRGNQLPDVGRPTERSTFGAKTGESARGPDRIDEPKAPRADTGRAQKADPPGKSGKTTAKGSGDPSPNVTKRPDNDSPGRDAQQPRVDLPKANDVPRGPQPRSKDVPRVEQPRSSDIPPGPQPRANDVPRVQPPRSNDVPKVQPPNRSPDVPRVQPPKSNDVPKVQPPNRSPDGPRVQPTRPSDTPNVQPPNRSPDVPRVQPPRSNDVPKVQSPNRSPDVPRVQPPRPSNDGPRVNPPGKSSDAPRIQPPNRGNENRGNDNRGNDAPRPSAQRNPTPNVQPRVSTPPPNIERPRNAPRADQPTFRSPPPRSEPRNAPRSEPKNDNPGGSTRSTNRESSSPSSNNNNSKSNGNDGNKGRNKTRDTD